MLQNATVAVTIIVPKKSFSAQTYMQAANIQKFVCLFKIHVNPELDRTINPQHKMLFNVKNFYLCVLVFQSLFVES